MLPTQLLIYRRNGEAIIPKRLLLDGSSIRLALELISCFQAAVGSSQGRLDGKLQELEGDSPNYRLQRGLAHLLKNHFSTFEMVSPVEPQLLRQRAFSQAARDLPVPHRRAAILEELASCLSAELQREVLPSEIEGGLYADLAENRILTQFDPPTPEALIHRYNLAQVQGIFYRASQIVLNAHRNDPGEYKLLFRYLKLFQLMFYIEGDADTGFTITLDGPASLFKPSTRYGLALAKMLPALLHVSQWSLRATLQQRDPYTGAIATESFRLDDRCGLVSHYGAGKTYDSLLEAAFANRWSKLDTPWRLEREVELVPLPGGVMIPDFRLVHPDGRDYLLEIVGYWHPQYLQKKFSQVRRAHRDNLILAVSERLNLEKAGVRFAEVPAKIVWFKDKLAPQAILALL